MMEKRLTYEQTTFHPNGTVACNVFCLFFYHVLSFFNSLDMLLSGSLQCLSLVLGNALSFYSDMHPSVNLQCVQINLDNQTTSCNFWHWNNKN